LDNAIQGHDPTKLLVAENQQVLMFGLVLKQYFIHPETLPIGRVQGFSPAARRDLISAQLSDTTDCVRPRSCSPTITRSGLKAAFSTGMAFSGWASRHIKMSNAA